MLLHNSQALLFPDLAAPQRISDATASTFIDNMRLPVHRWFRFSAGFSGAWAQHVIEKSERRSEARILDPFAGSGTTLVAAEEAGVPAIGVEAHPFVYRIAQAKLARHLPIETLREKILTIRKNALSRESQITQYPNLMRQCYTPEALSELDRLRAAVEETDDGSNASRLAWLALVGILRRCSHVGTAQWQYVLPRKSKKSVASPFRAFEEMCNVILADMTCSRTPDSPARLLRGDARNCTEVPDGFATLVLTSPPYPNNYDYADATRLEMSFLREINGWGDLHSAARQYLIRSCTQHVPERAAELRRVLAEPVLDPIRGELSVVCEQLAEIRLSRGGKKTYHLMVACYFLDMAHVWIALRRACAMPSNACFVIGDSAPYGVYVPVAEWLGKLALAAGFRSFRFERTRDRNVKWKNRKHRVPLCEGRLWVVG